MLISFVSFENFIREYRNTQIAKRVLNGSANISLEISILVELQCVKSLMSGVT